MAEECHNQRNLEPAQKISWWVWLINSENQKLNVLTKGCKHTYIKTDGHDRYKKNTREI